MASRSRGIGDGFRSAAFTLAKRASRTLGPIIPSQNETGVAARLRQRFCVMPGTEVVRVLDALETAGVHPIVMGGWGVDALLGEQTRPHGDLDLIVAAGDEITRANETMAALRYRFLHEEVNTDSFLPRRVVWQDRLGRTADLHPFIAADAPIVADPRFEPRAGSIGGRGVVCLSPQVQLTLREAHAVRLRDAQDVRELCTRFGLPLPARYATPCGSAGR
jgi:lincosamide nucleotidyltransferase A/C/D/E